MHHIKRENIGLIEVMGLAVLPARLKTELAEVEKYLLGEIDSVADIHQEWADKLKAENPNIRTNQVQELVERAVGAVFQEVLEDAGVFKRDQKGQEAFIRFIHTLTE